MSDCFLGEIKIFAGNYAPVSWALCNGQILTISGNEALFSLFNTVYGGNGQTSFGLPDLRGRLPVHMGQGPGLSAYPLGCSEGVETVTLSEENMPQHNHPMQASKDSPASLKPANCLLADIGTDLYGNGSDQSKLVGFSPIAIQATGNNTPHNNMMPYVCLNFIVSLKGVYPDRI